MKEFNLLFLVLSMSIKFIVKVMSLILILIFIFISFLNFILFLLLIDAYDLQHYLLVNCPINRSSTISIPKNTHFLYSTDFQPLSPSPSSSIERIQINAGYGNAFNSFDFSQFAQFSQLREMHIGISCFQQLREFIIKDFPNLELLNLNRENFQIWTRLDNDVWDCGNEGGSCIICSCPKLEIITIGSNVFFNYRSFRAEELPRLKVIQIGHYCLPLAHQFILRSRILSIILSITTVLVI